MYDDPNATRACYLNLLNLLRRKRARIRAMVPHVADMPTAAQRGAREALDDATTCVLDHLLQTRLRFGNSQAFRRRWEIENGE